MKTFIIFIWLESVQLCFNLPLIKRQATLKPPESDSQDDESIDTQIINIEEEEALANKTVIDSAKEVVVESLFGGHIDRTRAEKVLKRAIKLLNHKGKPVTARGKDHTEEAQKLLRLLTGEEKIGSTSSDSTLQSPKKRPKTDEDFCTPTINIQNTTRITSLNTMRRIVGMTDKGYSERTIRGQYPWYHRSYLSTYRQCLVRGGSRYSKLDEMDARVFGEFELARAAGHSVHDFMFRRWGRDAADTLNETSFLASDSWVLNFKQRHNLGSRKTTKLLSRPQVRKEFDIEESRLRFLELFAAQSSYFRHRDIYNSDQTGFSYEHDSPRTISNQGERNTVVVVENKNKVSHSYTVQPTISRDGRLIGKLLICLQETANVFGPTVQRRVTALEEKFKNVQVLASKSGKMSSELIKYWIKNVLTPALDADYARNDSYVVNADDEELDDDIYDLACGRVVIEDPASEQSRACRAVIGNEISRICSPDVGDRAGCMRAVNETLDKACTQRPRSLILLDSWSGHSNDAILTYFTVEGIKVLRIPPSTTAELQPLDVTFNRQYKYFYKRIEMEAVLANQTQLITSREGIINMHSLAWNQFSAFAYRDMLSLSWRHTDPDWSREEMTFSHADMAKDISFFGKQIQPTCGHQKCAQRAIVKCAHCGKPLCLYHYLNRTCFHETTEESEVMPNFSYVQINSSSLEPIRDNSRYLDADGNLPTSSQSLNHPVNSSWLNGYLTGTYDGTNDELKKRSINSNDSMTVEA